MAKISNVERVNAMVADGIMRAHASVYPMAEYVDPITTAKRMADELTALRKDKARLNWIFANAEVSVDCGGTWILDIADIDARMGGVNAEN